MAHVCCRLSFSRKYKEIMAGTYSGDLFEETNHALTIEILKGAMERFAFNTPNILKLELSAQVILAFLLDKFVHAVLYDDYQDKDRGFVPSKADKSSSQSFLIIISKTMQMQKPAKKHLTYIYGC